jgi:hypothetical protein
MPSSLRLPLRLCAFARVILLFLLFLPTALAARVERLIDTWRPTHYLVNITLNDQLSEITSASTRIYLTIVRPTREIDVDFGDLTVDRVTLNGTSYTFLRKNDKLHIDLPDAASPGTPYILEVQYHGKPKDGLILSNDKTANRPQSATTGPIESTTGFRHWTILPRKRRSRSTSQRRHARKWSRTDVWTTLKQALTVNAPGRSLKAFRFHPIA